MALIEVLEVLPHNHPHRQELIKQVVQLTHAYAKYQDASTGSVVLRSWTRGNTRELARDVELLDVQLHLYMAVQRRSFLKSSSPQRAKATGASFLRYRKIPRPGRFIIANICGGTNVGDLAFYLNRPRNTDDFHGLGAFLIMNERLRESPCVSS